jgi:hypothetical protein
MVAAREVVVAVVVTVVFEMVKVGIDLPMGSDDDDVGKRSDEGTVAKIGAGGGATVALGEDVVGEVVVGTGGSIAETSDSDVGKRSETMAATEVGEEMVVKVGSDVKATFELGEENGTEVEVEGGVGVPIAETGTTVELGEDNGTEVEVEGGVGVLIAETGATGAVTSSSKSRSSCGVNKTGLGGIA